MLYARQHLWQAGDAIRRPEHVPCLGSRQRSGSAEEPAPDDPVMRRVRLEEEWLAHFEGGETPATGTPEIDFGPVAFREISEETVPIAVDNANVAAHVRILSYNEAVSAAIRRCTGTLSPAGLCGGDADHLNLDVIGAEDSGNVRQRDL
jgi:hypothetical protein